MKLTFKVNGENRTRDVHPMKRLIDILRDDAGLKDVKEGCGEGECGACAVIMNGRLVNSCTVPALQAAGSEIMTVSALGSSVAPDALQKAFVEEGAVHCGFCTPGMVVAARALLERKNTPTVEDIRVGLAGNLCRCTGYEKIYRAIQRAVNQGYAKGLVPKISAPKSAPVFTPEEAENYFSPASLDEALKILAKKGSTVKIIAGATDVLPDIKNEKLQIKGAMDITRLSELKGITAQNKTIKIGACVTNTEIMESALLKDICPMLVEAAAQCGAVAVQNAATLGGNIVSASGAGDMIVALIALDASVVLASKSDEHTVSVERFITGHRATAKNDDEILKSIVIPMPSPGVRVVQAFYKRGSRAALTLSRVSLACYVEKSGQRIFKARFVAGSMSPVPHRLHAVEKMLEGALLDAKLLASAAQRAGEEVKPRKHSAYRKKVTENLTRKFLGLVQS